MAESSATLKGLRAQMVAAAQAQAEERRSSAGNSPGPTANTQAKPQGCRPVLDGAALRIDDRLRVAKERRDEAEKQQALRDSQIMERERKAKMQVERQLEERQKKVVEQRKKEEQKRIAVEEKRKQKQEEEKEHYEAVMRRTQERSQRVDQRQKRWSWGGLSTDSDGRGGDSDVSASSPVAIVISPASPEKPPRSRQVDKRSTSTMNLKQPSEANISKRLSSSSATLIKSPDKSFKSRSSSCNRLPSNGRAAQATKEDDKKLQVEQTGRSIKKRSSSLTRVSVGGAQSQVKTAKGTADDQARRPPVSTVDGGLLSRLLTPTQASIARSKSAAALSAEGSDAPASASPLHPPPRGPVRSRSIDRQQKTGMTTSVSADAALSASANKQDKQVPSPGRQRPPSPSIPSSRNRSPSPAPNPAPKRTPSPNTAKQSSKNRPPSPGAAKQRPPSPQTASAKTPPIPKPALTPTGPLRKRDSKSKDMFNTPPSASASSDSSKSKEKDDSKNTVGTNSASEAAKLLAENRRLMREQKEKEELLRLQKEEEEKVRKEEEDRLAEEARLKRVEEEKKLEEERKVKEEEDARLAEEERVRLAEEEAIKQAELQKEREEAEAKALEEAERVRKERDRIMKQNQQERMERKKRIAEIMKRTRKGDQDDSKRDDDKQDDDDDDDEDGDDEDDDDDDEDDVDVEDDDAVDDGADPMDPESKIDVDEAQRDGSSAENDKHDFALAAGEPVAQREDPLGSVNGKQETDDKENNNGVQAGEGQADSPVLTGRLVEGSDFLNEQDPPKVVSGLNGKSNPWNFEELIDHSVHSKSRPLLATDDCNQVINCEDKSAPVSTLHSNQPVEAMPEM